MMLIKSRKFSMPKLRVRAKKLMRSKYKKTIKLTDLDKVWNSWVEYNIVRPLLKYGSVVVDDKFSIEIIGKRIENDARALSLLSKGIAVTSSGFKINAEVLSRNRPGVLYKIVVTDKNYKGQLIFEPDRKLKKRVREHLINSQQVYK